MRLREIQDIHITNYLNSNLPTSLRTSIQHDRMDVEENTPAPAVEVSEAPKGGKMSVEDALQQVLKNAMVGGYTHGISHDSTVILTQCFFCSVT